MMVVPLVNQHMKLMMINLNSLAIMLCCLLGYTLFNIWLVVVFLLLASVCGF